MSWLDIHRVRHHIEGNNIRKEHELNTKRFISYSIKDSPSYKKVLINGIEYDTRMVEEKRFTVASGYSVTKLLFEPFVEPENGQVVLIDGEKWLTVYANSKKLAPYVHIRKCIYEIEVPFEKEEVKIPIVVDTSITENQKLKENFYIDLSTDVIKITAPYNEVTDTIYYKDRFVINKMAWEIQGINKISQIEKEKGIIELSAKKVPLTKEEEDKYLPKEKIDTTKVVLTIKGKSKVEQKGKLQLIGEVTYDGKIIEGGKVKWSSKNAVIDDNGVFIATCDTGDYLVKAEYEYVDGCGKDRIVVAEKEITVYNNKEWW